MYGTRFVLILDKINCGQPCKIAFDGVEAQLSRGNIILIDKRLGTKSFTSISSFVQFVSNQKNKSKISATQLSRVKINNIYNEDLCTILMQGSAGDVDDISAILKDLQLEELKEDKKEQYINTKSELLFSLQNLSKVIVRTAEGPKSAIIEDASHKVGMEKMGLNSNRFVLNSDIPKLSVLNVCDVSLQKNGAKISEQIVFVPKNSNNEYAISIVPRVSKDATVSYDIFREENGAPIAKQQDELFPKLQTTVIKLEQVSNTHILSVMIKYTLIVVFNRDLIRPSERVNLAV